MDSDNALIILPPTPPSIFSEYLVPLIIAAVVGAAVYVIVRVVMDMMTRMAIDQQIRNLKIKKIRVRDSIQDELDILSQEDQVEQTISTLFPGIKNTKKALRQAGNIMSVRVYALGLLFASFACSTFIHIPHAPAILMPFAWLVILHILMSKMILPKMIRSRQVKMIKQIPEMMDFIIRAVIVSKGLEDAISAAADELKAPLGPELAMVGQLTAIGMTLPQALVATALEIDTAEFDFFTSACIAKLDSGGELIAILRSISESVRGRIALFEEINAMTQEGKMSAYFLAGLPVALLAYLKFSKPDYVAPLFNTLIGNGMLAGAALLISFGTWVSLKIVSIKP